MDETGAPQIGPTLRRHRKSRGLTLEDLAELSGVSKSMLSQIERGQANPTLAVLWSLTRALKLDFADLLEGAGARHLDDEAIEVTSDAHTPQIRSADGLCRLRILSPPGSPAIWSGTSSRSRRRERSTARRTLRARKSTLPL